MDRKDFDVIEKNLLSLGYQKGHIRVLFVI